MKKFVTIILCLLYTSIAYSTIYEYVDESGRSFFYRTTKPFYEKGERVETMDEIDFIIGQGVSCFVESNDPNYNKEEMIEELKLKYRKLILNLYNQNREYMEKNFPEHTYTFEEVYDFAYDVSDDMIWFGCGCECHINMCLCIPNVLTRNLDKVKKHPYILGYLYKEEKCCDGKKCKLKQLSGIKIN